MPREVYSINFRAIPIDERLITQVCLTTLTSLNTLAFKHFLKLLSIKNSAICVVFSISNPENRPFPPELYNHTIFFKFGTTSASNTMLLLVLCLNI